MGFIFLFVLFFPIYFAQGVTIGFQSNFESRRKRMPSLNLILSLCTVLIFEAADAQSIQKYLTGMEYVSAVLEELNTIHG